ncbi:MAG: choice-of-anchor D domain-containing protein, partial [Candidatus Acidiferrales bacterium]
MGELKFRQGAVPQVLGLSILILSAALWTPAQAPNTINTIAGGGTNPTSPTAAYLGFPSAVVRDASNNVYIATPGLEVVYKVSAGGQLSIYAGTGIAGFSGDGGPANTAQLNFPLGLALDSTGDLYIADSLNNRIRRVDASTGVITTYAGSGDQYNGTGFFGGYGGDGGPAASAMMNFPSGLAFDASGDLFVGDASNEVVRKIDNTTGHIITTYAGNGKLGVPGTANGDGGPATSAQLNAYVGELLDVATDASGNLYIADSGDSVIRKVDTSASHIITTYAGSPSHTFTFSGNGGPANEAGLNTPEGLAFDASGDLFIADTFNGQVREVDTTPSHIITTVVGGGGACISFATGCGDGGAPASAFLNRPFALFVDAAANLFISDFGTSTVRVVSPSPSSIISTFAGGGNGGLGGLATSAVLSLPYTIVSDGSGNLFFLDRFSVNRYDSGSQTLGAYAGNGLEGINIGPGNGDGGAASQATLFEPFALALDSSGNLYIGDFYQWVRRVDAITKTITTYAGTGPVCNAVVTPACGDGGAATSATFVDIAGIATDSAGNLYISDAGLNRIRRVDVATGIITNYAGTGAAGHSGDGGPATSATLSFPYGLAFDSEDNLYVADAGNNVIRKIDNTPAHNITTYAFNGLPTFGGDGGPALSASMQEPLQVAVDSNGNVFVSGGYDNVVRRIDNGEGSSELSVITVAGDVQNLDGGFFGDGGPSTQALLDNFGVAVDGNENLYIADTGNDRIRKVHLAPVAVVTPVLPAQFGPVFAGSSSSATGVVEFGNTGLDDLQVNNVTASTGFVVTTCNGAINSFAVPPSFSNGCSITVAFSPAAGTPPGTVTGNLTFTTNDPANPSFTFPLTGVVGATPGVTLSVSGVGSGSILSSPSGIDCAGTTGTCSENLPVNAQVTLEAAPNTGNSFAGWTVNGSSTTCPGATALCTITMSAATSVVATFNTGSSSPPPTLTVAAAGNGSGTITSVPAGIDCTITDGTASGTCSFSGFAAGATVVSLRAAATAGSKFAGWLTTLCGLLPLSDTSGPCQFNLAYASIASPPQVTAVFSGAPQAFTPGQIFVGSYAGTILVYNPNGTLAQVLSSGNLSPNSPIYGMNFDSAGNLYAASPRASGVTDGTVEFFGNDGSGPTTFGTYTTGEPTDVLIDPSGNVFTGGGSGTALTISEFAGGQNAAPTSLLYPAYESSTGNNGAYIDLLDDNESMLYTAGGNWVGNFDVLYNHQNPDFADNLPGTGAYQIRELSDKSVLVAVTTEVVRLSPTGSIIQTYTPGGSGTFYALALNPDGLSFWTGDGITGTVYQIRISDGAVLDTVNTGLTFAQTGNPTIFGIAVLGSVASGAADVSVTMTGPASAVLQNLQFTYTITVRNNGPSTAANVAVTDPFPSGITVVSAVPSVGACQVLATVTCTLGTMTSGQTATITVVATSSLAGTVFNAANATTTTPDPNPANNEATTTTTVLPASTLQILAPFTGSGTVTDNLGQIDCVDTAGVLAGTCLATYATGTEVTLTGTPSAESVLSGWYPCTGSGTCTVEIGTSPQIAEVFFTPAVTSYTLSVAASGLGNGTITDSFGQIDCTSTAGVLSGACSASYAGGDVVVLTATAGTGSTFGSWSTCAGTGTCAVTMTSNQTVTATFAVAVTLKTITVTPANPTLGVNSTQTFLAIGAYSDGSTQNLTGTVTWSSGTTIVATISTTGFATAVAAGTSTISATSGSVVGSTVLTVVAQPYAYMGSVTSANCCLDVLNTSTNLVVATIPITNFNAPFGITPDQSRIYIADNVNNLLNVVDTTTNTLMTTIPIGVAPTAVAITPNGLYGYVADLGDNNVPVFNVATNALVTNVSVGFPTATLTASPDGAWVYAASALDNTFAVINTSTNTASSFTVGASTSCVAGPTFNPSGTLAFITEQTSCSTFPPTTTGFLDVVSVPTNSLVAAIPVGIEPIWSAVTPDGARLYVSNTFSNTVSVIDTATNTVIATVPVGTAPQTLAVTPDGTSVYVLNAASNTVSVIEISTNTVSATIPITTPFGIVIAAPPAASAATVLALKPPNLIFNPQVSGTTSGPQTISVTNPGAAAVTLTSIALTGPNVADFPWVNSCPAPSATLAAAGTCGLQFTFTPKATGARTAFVTITSTNGLASITQTAPITGTGTGATPTAFSKLTPSQSITAGTASISLAGVIGHGTTFPSAGETVSITINGVTQSAAIGTAGAFSATFATSTIPASTTPYAITYSYGGDATFTSASDSSTSLTVNALVTNYTLTISDLGTGTGAVTDNTGQINCSEASGVVTGACSGSYASGTEVILTETPSSPSTFAEWGGACASSGTGTSCTLTITSNLTASANFLPPPASVNLTFPAGVNPPPQQAVFNCPSNPNPSPTNPCTDPNAHVLQLQLPQVNSSFTVTVTATEVPPSQADGLCEVGNTVLNDFDCRFSTFFNYGTDANGNTIVPYCYPYANGN